MSFLRIFPIRYLLILAAVLLPFQPMALIANAPDSTEEALLAQIMKHMQGPSSYLLAKAALGKIPCFDSKKSILGVTERRELQIDALAKKLDKTETSFGSVALVQSLQPVANLPVIQQRQAWAKAMLDDAQLYTDIQHALKRIKKSEHAILAYWDATQRENGTKLFARAESFYYAWLQIILGERINDSKWALESAMILKMLGIVWDVIYYFGGQELWWDLLQSQFDENVKFNPYRSVIDGLGAPVMFLWPYETEVSRKIRNGEKVNQITALRSKSSFGDTNYIIRRGMNSKTEIEFGKLGQAIWWASDKCSQITKNFITTPLSEASQFLADNCVPNFVKKGTNVVKNHTPGFIKNVGVPNFIKEGFGHLDSDGTWATKSVAIKDPDKLEGFAWYRNQTYGLMGALAVSGIKGQLYLHGIKTTYNSTKNTIKTMKELHIHTMHLARAINTIKALVQQLEKHPVLGSSCMVAHINNVITNASAELKQLFVLLENDTFSTEKAKTHIFSRGNVFLAHRLMTKVCEEIVPLLQGLGELDALYAIVTNIKESATTKLPFSFVEFVPQAHAMIDIKEGWLPLVRNAVPNTITFGGEKPNKIIITGPNGGGKSVLLKLGGGIVVLAQSWGAVPAEHVRMTLLDGLRSCIHPEESLEHELSTFMAEKMRVDEIKDFVFTHHHDPHFKVMLLLDEPFRGTVDAESADRIYDFGKTIASLQQVIVLIATHVEKPIKLAQDTNGIFANYHVRIKELENGRFEREFKLEPGTLEWWFTDAQKRSRFIDFVTMEKHKEEIAQMVATRQVEAVA